MHAVGLHEIASAAHVQGAAPGPQSGSPLGGCRAVLAPQQCQLLQKKKVVVSNVNTTAAPPAPFCEFLTIQSVAFWTARQSV